MRAAIIFAIAMLAVVATATVSTVTQRDSIEIQLHLRSAKHTEAEVEDAFVQRSTPGSKLFRQHLSQDELVDLVGASAMSIDEAVSFLRSNGAKAIKVLSTNDVVVGHVTQEANLAAFELQAADFTVEKGFRRIIESETVKNIYHAIVIAIDLGEPTKVRRVSRDNKLGNPFPGMTITPADIFARYNTPTTPANAPEDFTSGVAEYQASVFTQNDIETFSKFYKLPVPTVNVIGPNVNGSQDNTEGTLDLEYITAVSGGINTWWIAQNGSNPDPMGLDFSWWCDEVLSIPTPPSVVSISWGMGTYHYAWAPQVLDADNRAFRKLGLRGISVFVASGDSGPGARTYLTCKKFMPGWPTSSPYVTSVGATYANSAADVEEAVSFSGGGFSDHFPTPSYQAEAVSAYLNSGHPNMPNTSFYNATGRGFPDVAALGTNYQIYFPSSPGGSSMWGPVSGTSCASPTFAAIITRINLERKQAGKPYLGFLNPTLYKLGKVGYDVVDGQSVDKDCFGIFAIKGFPATKGWDAVSGLGTPDYNFLSKNL